MRGTRKDSNGRSLSDPGPTGFWVSYCILDHSEDTTLESPGFSKIPGLDLQDVHELPGACLTSL